MHLLSASSNRPSALLADMFSRCLLCGACEQVCSRQLPITQIIAHVRSRLPQPLNLSKLQQTTACIVLGMPALVEVLVKAGIGLRRIYSLPQDSGLRLKLALLEERTPAAPLPLEFSHPQTDCSYFTGCFARHLQPSIVTATTNLLKECKLTPYISADQCCCGLAAWSSGRLEQARELAKRNIEAFRETKGPILTSCASCSAHLLAYPDLFAESDPWWARAKAFAARVREFTEFFNEHLPNFTRSCRLQIFYHDPCHLRFRKNGMTTPRQLLKKTGYSILEPKDGPHCCGQGGLFHLTCPDTSAKIFAKSSLQALAANPDYITSTCSGCLIQYQQGLVAQNKKIQVVHLAILLNFSNPCTTNHVLY